MEERKNKPSFVRSAPFFGGAGGGEVQIEIFL